MFCGEAGKTGKTGKTGETGAGVGSGKNTKTRSLQSRASLAVVQKPHCSLCLPMFRVGQFLGKGSRKTVHAEERNGRMVAVMRSQTHDLQREAMLMMQIGTLAPHPHVMKLLTIECDALSKVSMVAPIALFGSMLDLADHLEFDSSEIGPLHKRTAFMQALSAVLHLGSLGIDHGDVAARNVLVFHYNPLAHTQLYVQLCDFGDAKSGCVSAESLCGLARELACL
jgi:hypothetical protein